jgi:wyosine [tRNA(Phe)-imidazoG37] synthetase (radical SAM superfamily)
MTQNDLCITFGPVPSRRLGRSLGINNIPPKVCSYACVYCQIGPTPETELVPRAFYGPDQIFGQVKKHLARVTEKGEQVDYLTFVPDGEPSLDARLSETVERLRPLGIPIAVISNASLIWRQDVRETLARADWVSLKVDAVEDDLWRRINRPHPTLDHRAILEGMLRFASEFKGTLATESMLVRGLNDTAQAASHLASFLGKLAPDITYLSVPTRPPAEKGVHAPDEATLNLFYQTIGAQVNHVELMTGYEGNAFASTGNVVEDLLAITSVHPMREEAVRELLSKARSDWHLVERLIDEHQLIQTEYEGQKFYVRCLE